VGGGLGALVARCFQVALPWSGGCNAWGFGEVSGACIMWRVTILSVGLGPMAKTEVVSCDLMERV